MAELDTSMHHHYSHDNGYNRGDYGRNGYELDTLILSNQMATGHQQIGDKVHTSALAGIKETADAARDTVDAVRDSINATNQIGNINLQAAERNGGETRASVFQAAGTVRDQLAAGANQTARDFSNQNREICEVRSEMAQGFGNTDLRTSEKFGATNLEISKQHCEIKLEMHRLNADLARQIAECCCEQKELVRAENAATRQLLQSQELDNSRRRESTLQGELNLLKFAQMTSGPGNS